MKLLHEFEHEGRTMRMYLGAYLQGRGGGPRVPAIEVRSLDPDMDFMESPYGRLTVNLPNGPRLGPWGIHVKTWSENEELAQMAMATGVFSELEFQAPTGFAQATTWSIRPDRIRLEALDYAICELGLVPSRRDVLTVVAREAHVLGAQKARIEIVDGAGPRTSAFLDFDSSGALVLGPADSGEFPMDHALDAGVLECAAFGCLHRFDGQASEAGRMKAFVADVLQRAECWTREMSSSRCAEARYERPAGQ